MENGKNKLKEDKRLKCQQNYLMKNGPEWTFGEGLNTN
jgi:hypothetical protein